IKLLSVVWFAVKGNSSFSFFTSCNAVVKVFEHRGNGIAEFMSPVKRTTLCSSRAVGIHPVHTVLSNKRHKALCKLFYCFVERFRRCMASFTKLVVLSLKYTLYSAH